MTWWQRFSNLDTMTYRVQQLFIYTAVTLAVILLMLGFINRVEAVENYECSVTMDQVQPNDTVWRIVERNCEGNIRNAVYDTVEMRKGNTVVHIGQWILLPADP